MCSLVTRSCCISLETRLVLNSDYIKQFSLCVCVLLLSLLMFPADWLMFKQLHMFGESPVLYTFAGWWPVCLYDEQKTRYWCIRSASSISFLLHCIISKGGCMSIRKLHVWLYLRGKGEFWTFHLSGALCDTRGFMFNTTSFLSITSTHRSSPSENVYRTGDFPNTSLTCM